MYNLFKDAILSPQNLLAYRNKRFWFVFAYVLILSLLVSLGPIVRIMAYSGNSVVTSATTGCTISGNSLICEGANYDPDRAYAFFGYSAYFLNSGDSPADPADQRLVFRGDRLQVFVNEIQTMDVGLSGLLSSGSDFDAFMADFSMIIRYGSAPAAILSSALLFLSTALLGTLLFLRLFPYVRYRVIFKLVLFALAPASLVFTFNNLLGLPAILFWILLFLALRSVSLLQMILARETMSHLGGTGANPWGGSVVETQVPHHDSGSDQDSGDSDSGDSDSGDDPDSED